jgi:hypothetical protein
MIMTTFASLDGVTGIGPGISRQLAKAAARHTMIVRPSGFVTACVVILQGSHDGFNWTDIGQVNSSNGGLINTTADGALVSWVRADLRGLGGTGDIVATIASDDGI